MTLPTHHENCAPTQPTSRRSDAQCVGSRSSSYSSTTSDAFCNDPTARLTTESLLAIAQGVANSSIGGPQLFATGRIRSTSHDGYVASNGNGFSRTNPYDASESSVFGSAAFTLPGTCLGGNIRLTGLAGETFLTSELKPLPHSGTAKGRIGDSETTATFFGGSALIAWKSGWYAVGTAIGFLGQTELTDKINLLRAKYDNSGWVGNITVGTVVPLTDIAPGLKLDLRGAAGYGTFSGDSYSALNARFTPSLSLWTATFAPMLFADIPMNGGTLRPYAQGSIKGYGDYDNQLRLQFTDGTPSETIRYTQHNTFWGAEIGLNYGINNWTLGVAGYTERSKSEETYGGKLGAAYKF